MFMWPPLANIIREYGFTPFSYADDTQLLLSFDKDTDLIDQRFAKGMLAISAWMTEHCLQLNAAKTEILLFGSAQASWSPKWWPAVLSPAPSTTVAKNLGVRLDVLLSMKDQIMTTAGTCYHTLCLLRRVFLWLPLSVRRTLIQALIIGRLDYCNALLASAN